MKKVLSAVLSLSMLLALATGCGSGGASSAAAGGSAAGSDSSDDVIRIGIFEPFTGGMAAAAEHEFRGIQLANELYPEVNGRKIELVKVDNKSDAVEAATAAQRLIEKEKVDIILGSYGSSLCMAAGDAVKAAEVPTISATATNANVTLGNPYYYRACFLDSFQGPSCATYCYRDLGYKTAGIIYEITNDSCVGLNQYFNDTFTSLGGEIIGVSSFSLNDQDFSSQLLAVCAGNPDVIFCTGTSAPDLALMIQQARSMGYNTPFISTDAMDVPEFISVGGEAVEGTMCSTFFDVNATMSDMSEEFVKLYTEKYNMAPAAMSALAFDSYLAAYEALKSATSTKGSDLKAALDQVNIECVTGTLSFDENGDANKDSCVIRKVVGGEWAFETVFKK